MLSILRELVPEPTADHARIAAVVSVSGLDRWVAAPRTGRGRPACDRRFLARAFLAKFVLQYPSTERLRHRLMADESLRVCLGLAGPVPSAATFSRAFSEFAELELGQTAHQALAKREYASLEVWHVARDSTAISNWERPVRAPKPALKAKQKPGRKKGVPPKPKLEPRQQRQLRQDPQTAISELPKACSTGTKLDSRGFPHWWNGYKLHADVDETGFPLAVVLTSASVHDSQAAIPLMKMTASITKAVFYQLMDAGYVGEPIREAAYQLGQVPIVAPKAARGQTVVPLTADRQRRLKRRNAVERFFAQLKNNAALVATRYRGHSKVSLHIMLAVIAICAAMILKQRQINYF